MHQFSSGISYGQQVNAFRELAYIQHAFAISFDVDLFPLALQHVVQLHVEKSSVRIAGSDGKGVGGRIGEYRKRNARLS